MSSYPLERLAGALGFAATLLVSCATVGKPGGQPLDPVQLQIQNSLLARLRQLDTDVGSLKTDFLELRKQLMLVEAAQYCPNPTVRNFIRSCKENSVECSIKAIEDSLKIMTDFRPVMLRFHIGQKPNSLNSAQIEAVKGLLAEHQNTFATKLLVVTMPSSERPTSLVSEAERCAKGLSSYLVEEFYPKLHPADPKLPRLGPYTVGCAQKAALMQKYRKASKEYRGLEGEPKDKDGGEPIIIAWIFLVDC